MNKLKTSFYTVVAMSLSLAASSSAFAYGNYDGGYYEPAPQAFEQPAYNPPVVQEYARVVRVEPIYTNYTQRVQRGESCYDQNVRTYQGGGFNGGSLLGAVVGGVIGHQFGKGSGNAWATGAGAVLGAGVGSGANQGREGYATQRVCSPNYEYVRTNVISQYKVTYTLRGNNYVTYTNQDPGSRILVESTVRPAGY